MAPDGLLYSRPTAGPVDWAGGDNLLGLAIKGARGSPSGKSSRMAFVALNPQHGPASISLPAVPAGCAWRRVVDTAAAQQPDSTSAAAEALAGGHPVEVGPRSGLLFLCVPVLI